MNSRHGMVWIMCLNFFPTFFPDSVLLYNNYSSSTIIIVVSTTSLPMQIIGGSDLYIVFLDFTNDSFNFFNRLEKPFVESKHTMHNPAYQYRTCGRTGKPVVSTVEQGEWS